MCGIIGYTGFSEAAPILLGGLRRLEYRGYDSAGLVTVEGGRLHLRKLAGRIDCLAALLENRPAAGTCGIGHTRWWPPCRCNCSPTRLPSCAARMSIVRATSPRA